MNDFLFQGTSGPRDAKIAIVGEAFGYEEAQQNRPFVGESGRELDKMLAEAGINRNDVFCTNIVADQPPREYGLPYNDMRAFFYPTKEARELQEEPLYGLYPKKKVREGLERLTAQLRAVNPDLIIGCGNYPQWALSDAGAVGNSNQPAGWKVPTGVGTWRGSQLRTTRLAPGIKFLPVLHPASILRNWPTRPITVHDLRVRVPLALEGKWDKPAYDYLAPPSFRQALDYFRQMESRLRRGPVEIAADLETASRTITCLGLSHDGESAISIPFLRQVVGGGRESFWTFSEEKALVRYIRALFHHPNAQIIGQNFLYDTQYMSRWWRVKAKVVGDTMLAQHVMFPGTPKALGYLASVHCRDHYVFWKEDSKEWEENFDLESHLIYNCDDAINTWKIWQSQKQAITSMGLDPQYQFLLEEWYLAFEMMETGIRVDQKVRADMTLRVAEEAAKRQDWLNEIIKPWLRPVVGKTAKPWYSSAKQQMELFYEILGCKTVHHRKTGNVTIDDTALDDIKVRYPELSRLVKTIAELRSLGVFKNNFLSAAIDPDGRMRCSFNVAGPETFRWSSSENAFGRGTNLQNIPKGDD